MSMSSAVAVVMCFSLLRGGEGLRATGVDVARLNDLLTQRAIQTQISDYTCRQETLARDWLSDFGDHEHLGLFYQIDNARYHGLDGLSSPSADYLRGLLRAPPAVFRVVTPGFLRTLDGGTRELTPRERRNPYLVKQAAETAVVRDVTVDPRDVATALLATRATLAAEWEADLALMVLFAFFCTPVQRWCPAGGVGGMTPSRSQHSVGVQTCGETKLSSVPSA